MFSERKINYTVKIKKFKYIHLIHKLETYKKIKNFIYYGKNT